MNPATGVQPTAAAVPAQPRSSPAALALQTIAHELRQPLSAIESIAYYLSLVLARDDHRAREQVSRLQQLVEQSNWILSSGLHLVDETPLAPEPVDLEELITQALASSASHGDPDPQLDLAGQLPPVRLDPGRGRVLIESLLGLFRQLSNHVHPICLKTSRTEAGVGLAITTASPGYRSEASLGLGCGLSLASARRIVEAHNGTFHLEVDAGKGVSLMLILLAATLPTTVALPSVVLP
jgi:signal transduction histidine kinase